MDIYHKIVIVSNKHAELAFPKKKKLLFSGLVYNKLFFAKIKILFS